MDRKYRGRRIIKENKEYRLESARHALNVAQSEYKNEMERLNNYWFFDAQGTFCRLEPSYSNQLESTENLWSRLLDLSEEVKRLSKEIEDDKS